MTIIHFKLLIAFNIALLVLGGTIDFIYTSESVYQIYEFADSLSSESVFPNQTFELVYACFSLFIMLGAYVGMWMTRNWGRWLYILSYFSYLPFYYTSDVYITSAIAQCVYDLTMMTSGAIIAFAYSLPIALLFNNRSTAHTS